jgi:YfiH family protein
MVTKQPGVVLGIVTADCAPVLLADREAGVIGAAHAGWRGALHGVTDQTIAAMESLGARRNRIAAAVGPCIAMASYEVDAAFRDTFCAASSENAAFFATGAPNHWQFDLSGYLLQRLKTSGIGAIAALSEDTYTQPERFYSYRRATHRGEATYGRQLALIGLEGA